eukprot:CAMPEP_0202357266 /NCGR_PEP_ID=MMETSP1126-20121109/11362_1 /ASSEMBLY_ACC=CAM_ASM_000457 /TAXON_ID=3047 /ORGANISM="Dunaliella tertiolecta, Strain CCMP1320" /LENGTH=445 /DNA_ID=CAMNT_0048950113 /DNA_START=101 /DNA_END=1438 /DNA_ORIENTATION=-
MSAAQGKFFKLQDEKDARLALVQVVFRHGARTPLTSKHKLFEAPEVQWDCCGSAFTPVPISMTTIDGKPAPENSHNTRQIRSILQGGCHMGQLTTQGQLQALDFGQWLRKRYIEELGFLPPQYKEGMLHARTTNFQRTALTLAGVLTGLLGDTGGKAIPVVTSSDVDEILVADTKACPNLANLIAVGKKIGKELCEADDDYEWACNELKRILPEIVDDFYFNSYNYQFTDIHDVITSCLAAGKAPYPGLEDPRLAETVNRLATKEFGPLVAPTVSDEHGHKHLRLSMGILLKTMTENMEAAINAPVEGAHASLGPTNETKAKLPLIFLYSGHDSTIMPLLSSLGVTRLTQWPPYLSNLVFELWELPSKKETVVRVLRDRQPLDIPHCPPGHCPTLTTFRDEVIGSLFITREALAEACVVEIDHDTSMPKPRALSMASRSEEPDDN